MTNNDRELINNAINLMTEIMKFKNNTEEKTIRNNTKEKAIKNYTEEKRIENNTEEKTIENNTEEKTIKNNTKEKTIKNNIEEKTIKNNTEEKTIENNAQKDNETNSDSISKLKKIVSFINPVVDDEESFQYSIALSKRKGSNYNRKKNFKPILEKFNFDNIS